MASNSSNISSVSTSVNEVLELTAALSQNNIKVFINGFIIPRIDFWSPPTRQKSINSVSLKV